MSAHDHTKVNPVQDNQAVSDEGHSTCCGSDSIRNADPNAEIIRDPICGMTVDPSKGKPKLHYEGHDYHFCSESCRNKFEGNPASYIYAVDPVCGMKVNRSTARYFLQVAGEKHYFCSEKCLEKFEKDPENHGRSESQAMPAGTQYTCPMHPEIISDKPDACPLCGMALEPMGIAGLLETENPELTDFSRRFWISTLLAIPVFILSMGPMVGLPVRELFGEGPSNWIEFLLTTPIVLWAATPFFVRGWGSIVNRSPNMWTLIAIGVAAAYGYSVVALLFPGIFPASLVGHGGSVPVYFESAAVIVALVFLGQVLELKARAHTNSAIRALMDLSPKSTRRVLADGSEIEVPLEDVRVGDLLRVRPGDAIPVDGVVTEGQTYIDEAMITGEPVPVEKVVGDTVTAGTLNKNGSLLIVAEKVGMDTMLSRIVEMVAEAQRSRAPIQSLADKVAAWFVPTVVLVAIVAFGFWFFIGPEPQLIHAIVAAVSVLIIACPCALGLATPMSIMTATGRGAQAGVLVRNAAALERMAEIDTLVIDKTGTITEGKPKLTDVIVEQGNHRSDVLSYAASLERGSEHPLADAIVSGAEDEAIAFLPVESFNAVNGKGVEGVVSGRSVVLGNILMMQDFGIDILDMENLAAQLQNDGKTALFVAIDHKIAGVIAVADPIKASAQEAIRELHSSGIRIIMATGDNARTAQVVADKLGIDEVHADVLPEHKKELIDALKHKGAVVAMAGDGINDAPALAAADVGIAMGTGADVAVESAGITLVKGELTGILRARKLAVTTMRNIKQNLFFAFLYNAGGVPIAAGILYPVFGLLLSPMIAAAAMSLSSVSVIANALRLRAIKI